MPWGLDVKVPCVSDALSLGVYGENVYFNLLYNYSPLDWLFLNQNWKSLTLKRVMHVKGLELILGESLTGEAGVSVASVPFHMKTWELLA